MKFCSFEKYFSEYIDGQLMISDEIEFLGHIERCPTCPSRLDAFYYTHRILKNVNRPQPDAMLIEEYANRLTNSFSSPALLKRWYYSLDDIINRWLPSPSLWWRFAAILAVLISGVFIGRFLLRPVEPELTLITDIPFRWEKPISNADIEYINYYLLASEMILLEIENVTPEDSDILISHETAQKLLMKTFLVHESALQLNSQQLLHFLSKMELILYELANADEGDNEELMESIRMVINESDLLEETRRLQRVIEDTKKG